MAPTTDNSIINSFKKEAKEKGVTHVTIANIAERCGCARQTIYYHFRGSMDLIKWITLNECSDLHYDSLERNRWKNEMYRLLCTLKSNDWLFEEIQASKLWDEYEEFLTKTIREKVVHEFFMTCSDYGSLKSRECLARMLTFTFSGEIINWVKNKFDESPLEIMQDFDRLFGSAMHKVIEDFLILRPQEQTARAAF